MAKYPVPKRKASHERKHRRHSTWRTINLKRITALVHTVPCPKCKQPRLSHAACPTCGEYRGRVVINFAKAEKKVTKVKA